MDIEDFRASEADFIAPETEESVDLKLLEWGLALISPDGREYDKYREDTERLSARLT